MRDSNKNKNSVKYQLNKNNPEDPVEEDGEDPLDNTIMRSPNQASLSRKQMLKHASLRFEEKEERRFQEKHKKYMKHKKRGLFVLDLLVLIFSFINFITEAIAFHKFLVQNPHGVTGAQGFVCVISGIILVLRAVNDIRWMYPYVIKLCTKGDAKKSNVEASWRGAISVLQLVLEDFLVIIINRIVTTSKQHNQVIISASCLSLLATSMSTLAILLVACFCLITTSIEYCFLRKVTTHLRKNAKRLSHLRTKRDFSRKLILPLVCVFLSALMFTFSVALLHIGCSKNSFEPLSNETETTDFVVTMSTYTPLDANITSTQSPVVNVSLTTAANNLTLIS